MRTTTRILARIATAVLLVATLAPRSGAKDEPTWIVVTAPAFREAIEPLVEHRRETCHVEVVDLADLRGPSGEAPDAARVRARIDELARAAGPDCWVLLVGTIDAPPVPATSGAAAKDAPSLPDPDTVVPAFSGTVEKMRGEPTDNPYGSLDDDRLPEIAVGRFPARTVEQAKTMVEKTIVFEAQLAPRPWRRRISLIVGNPGGTTPIERKLAAYIVDHEVSARFEKLGSIWYPRALVHVPGSPFFVPDEALEKESVDLVNGGQLFTVYLGHSNARALWSGRRFFTTEDWSGLSPRGTAGVLLSCGCHTCQLTGWDGEGYGLAALRAPHGPVAVVGAHVVSDGAMGKLAFEGLLPLLAASDPPRRLGDWYLAMKRGIGKGPISPLIWWLYDHADGSGGKLPLEVVRQEHLEMWMLLGDPALELPLEPPEIALGIGDLAASIEVSGTLPKRLAYHDVRVRVAVERPFGVEPPDAPPIPEAEGPARDAAILARRRRANDRTIVEAVTTAKGGTFSVRLSLPDTLPKEGVVLRAEAEGDDADGAVRVVLPH